MLYITRKVRYRRATTKKKRLQAGSTLDLQQQWPAENYEDEGSVCNVYRYKCNNKENGDEGVLLYMIKLQCLLVPVVVDICFFFWENMSVSCVVGGWVYGYG